jgi:hypothetical protein
MLALIVTTCYLNQGLWINIFLNRCLHHRSFLFFYTILSYCLFFVTILMSWSHFLIFPCSFYSSELVIGFTNIMHFNLRFITLILTSTIPLNLFMEISVFISHHINYCFYHLFNFFNLKLPFLIKTLIHMVLLFIRVFTRDVLSKVNFRLKPTCMGTHNPTQLELQAWVYFKMFF